MSVLDADHFRNDDAARKLIESLRWPNGPVCHHCGETQRRYPTKREGRFRCGNPECRKDFTATTGTVMESSKVALHKWLTAFYLMCASKKGVSSHQIHRTLGVTYKTAWFMTHRIREAMREGGLVPPMGGEGGVVEADETYFGKTDSPKKLNTRGKPFTKSGKPGPSGKRAIVSLVERGGSVRSFHVAVADKATVHKLVVENIARETRVFTDESKLYGDVKINFAEHSTVRHSAKEYVRGDVHTNTIEGVFSIFKRGMKGIYQHCAEKHTHRYLAEFDFRYNHRVKLGISDEDRTFAALRGIEGKRLTYQRAGSA